MTQSCQQQSCIKHSSYGSGGKPTKATNTRTDLLLLLWGQAVDVYLSVEVVVLVLPQQKKKMEHRKKPKKKCGNFLRKGR